MVNSNSSQLYPNQEFKRKINSWPGKIGKRCLKGKAVNYISEMLKLKNDGVKKWYLC